MYASGFLASTQQWPSYGCPATLSPRLRRYRLAVSRYSKVAQGQCATLAFRQYFFGFFTSGRFFAGSAFLASGASAPSRL